MIEAHLTDDGEEIRLGTYVDIADELGVSVNQVYTWFTRRVRNGFPDPVLHKRAKNGVKDAPHFDVDQARAWHLFYVPAKGGADKHKRRASQA